MDRRKFLLAGFASLVAPKPAGTVSYIGKSAIDAGLFYCPYVPLSHVGKSYAEKLAREIISVQPMTIPNSLALAFKTRYANEIPDQK